MIFGGLQFLAREILARAEEELYDADSVHREMTEAYASLEAGGITEEEFDRREQQLMERLEAIEARRQGGANEGDEGDDDGDESGDDGDESDDDESSGEVEAGEAGEESESEVHYGVFDDEDADEDADVPTDVRARVEAHASRRAP